MTDIPPWRDRLFAAQPDARNLPTGSVHELGSSYKDEEIAALRAEIERRDAQASQAASTDSEESIDSHDVKLANRVLDAAKRAVSWLDHSNCCNLPDDGALGSMRADMNALRELVWRIGAFNPGERIPEGAETIPVPQHNVLLEAARSSAKSKAFRDLLRLFPDKRGRITHLLEKRWEVTGIELASELDAEDMLSGRKKWVFERFDVDIEAVHKSRAAAERSGSKA